MTDVFIICQLKEDCVDLKSSHYRFMLYVSFTSTVVKPPADEEIQCGCSSWEIIACYGGSYLGQIQWGDLVWDLM